MSKGKPTPKTLSKYGRLHFDDKDDNVDVESFFNKIKQIENGTALRKQMITGKNVVPQRLFSNDKAVKIKQRKISRPKAKVIMPAKNKKGWKLMKITDLLPEKYVKKGK